MAMDENSVLCRAQAAGQECVFDYWCELTQEERQALLESTKDIDFELINKYYRRLKTEAMALSQLDSRLEALPSDCCADSSSPEAAEWYGRGMDEIKAGRVAVLLLAGGQGTRLGSSQPKGMYEVGLPSRYTLYQIQAERIRKLQLLAQGSSPTPCVIPWYIMTSDATQELTKRFFEAHNYFNLSKDNVYFFQQGTLPCLDFEGKIMLETKSRVSVAPDGNGGLYKALGKSGALMDMRDRGIVHIHVYCVDNILVRVADPIFVGYCMAKGADCGSKVVAKKDPSEAVGVLCLRDEQYAVVEYSEISQETAEKRDRTGRLLYDAANIVNHYFSIDFLERVCRDHASDLPLHIAKKKIATVGRRGHVTDPGSINGMKMEMFVFDVFQYATNMAVLYVNRDDEFSPLKNGPGASSSSPAHCRDDLMAICRRWIRAAGGSIDDDTPCYISPMVSYCGEGLASLVAHKKFNTPLILQVDQSACTLGA